MIKALFIRDIIADYGSDSIPIVASGYGFKTLLTCLNLFVSIYSIPNLQFDIVIIDFKKFRSKLYSNGDLMFLSVAFIGVLEQKT
jgi:hypothetical protein